MKKVILGILALFLAITVVIVGYVLVFAPELQSYTVEGVSCPYSWQELRDGTYRLEIDTTAYPDYAWSVETYPKNIIAATEESGEAGTAVFSILPLNEGQTYVQVYCEQTEPFTVRVFEIGMQISVSEDNRITVVKTEEKEYAGIATLGEGGDYPIQWWAQPDGTLNLLITDEMGGSWEIVDDHSDRLDVVGPFYRQGSCGFEIRGKQAGVAPLTLFDGGTQAIWLEVSVTEELTAAVTTFSVGAYSIDRSEEHAALETMAGRAIALPQQAAETAYFVSSKSGTVDFLLNDAEWRWEISTDMTEEDIAEDFAAYATETEIASVGGMVLTAYHLKDGVTVCWHDGNCMMLLYCEREATMADALAVAGQIAEANHGQ